MLAPDASFEIDGTYTKKDIIKKLNDNVCIVWLKIQEFDKFGRILGDIYRSKDDTETIQSILIAENYCKPYAGQTKSQWVPDECRCPEPNA